MTQTEALNLALDALKQYSTYEGATAMADKAISAIHQALAQQSNEQSKCNHTKTITRADIDGNQIETTCGECGERVAQQSNEQVEPVAYRQWIEPNPKLLGYWMLANPDTKDKCWPQNNWEPLFAHPPVPYVVEPRTAQPEQPDYKTLAIQLQKELDDFKAQRKEPEPEQSGFFSREAMRAHSDFHPKEPEQEPVGYWMGEFNDGLATLYEVPQESVFGRKYQNIPVYTTPPQPKEPEQEPVAIPDWPESESLADLEYAQNTPETWGPEYRQVWQELQVAERNKAILRRYAKELRALLTIRSQRKPLTEKKIYEIYEEVSRQSDYMGTVTRVDLVRAIEATHGITASEAEDSARSKT